MFRCSAGDLSIVGWPRETQKTSNRFYSVFLCPLPLHVAKNIFLFFPFSLQLVEVLRGYCDQRNPSLIPRGMRLTVKSEARWWSSDGTTYQSSNFAQVPFVWLEMELMPRAPMMPPAMAGGAVMVPMYAASYAGAYQQPQMQMQHMPVPASAGSAPYPYAYAAQPPAQPYAPYGQPQLPMPSAAATPNPPKEV